MQTIKRTVRQRPQGADSRFHVIEYDLQVAESLADCITLAGSEAAVVRMFNKQHQLYMDRLNKPKPVTLSAVEKLMKKVSVDVRSQLELLPREALVDVVRKVQRQTIKAQEEAAREDAGEVEASSQVTAY